MDETPILRADATDDDLQLEPKFATGGFIGKPDNDPYGDAVPALLSGGCAYLVPHRLLTDELIAQLNSRTPVEEPEGDR